MVQLARRIIRHPRWTIVGVKQVLVRHSKEQGFAVEAYPDFLTGPRDAVASALGLPSERVEEAMQSDWWPDGAAWGAGSELMQALRAIILLRSPETVVEAGVAAGVSSAVILKAMAENGRGELHSIDLPLLGKDEEVGKLVPDQLRDRWSLRLGPASDLLSPLLEEVGPVDLFLHDADHAYGSQLREYRVAWPHLKSGGVLLSDDVDNPAFVHLSLIHI